DYYCYSYRDGSTFLF
nr:immunoglobulin light chain junction region [Macaca mulatta]MOW56471.1 immunoglobulin light chain junction region [Macaca mulatta]MOW58737.1 immunoglobulin light chain junction region [Macaca mulatta]MOW59309.1 immunoglobulin light chain junction region [Macaca mulatta]MOW60957.1 immunoglobulin light chain junction region [Macaca mulatta]